MVSVFESFLPNRQREPIGGRAGKFPARHPAHGPRIGTQASHGLGWVKQSGGSDHDDSPCQ